MKIIRNILAGFISIIYLVMLFVMILISFASNAFSANYYKEILTENDLSKVKVSDLGITSLSEQFDEDATVEDILVEPLEKSGISKDDAIKIVNSPKVNDVVGNFLSDTMNYLTNNGEIPQLNYQDAIDIINSDEVSSVLENKPDEEEIKLIVDKLNEFILEKLEGGFSYDQ